jgi:hypothetical protein
LFKWRSLKNFWMIFFVGNDGHQGQRGGGQRNWKRNEIY